MASVKTLENDDGSKSDGLEKDKNRFLGSIRRSYSNRRTPDTFIEETRDLWQRMDNSFYNTIGFTQLAYRSTNKISYVVVAMGVIFLLNSIAYTWFYGINQWGLFTGGLSLVSFISLFFTRPQKDIQLNAATALGNLSQIQMIYKLYSLQFAALADSNKRDPCALYESSKDFKEIVQDYVKLVQMYIENNSKTEVSMVRTEDDKKTELQVKREANRLPISTEEMKESTKNIINTSDNGSTDFQGQGYFIDSQKQSAHH